MVLHNHKPVKIYTAPSNLPNDAEVFVMPGTDEVFGDYEQYLKRFSTLSQKQYEDEVHGITGLSYMDALRSESQSSPSQVNAFPSQLREAILRNAQFSTLELDQLVDHLYKEHKHDFFPGEEVYVTDKNGIEREAVVREKVAFPVIRGEGGKVIRPASARYMVKMCPGDEEGLMLSPQVKRFQNVFSKTALKAFLRHALWRESWRGAPWMVKHNIALYHRLPMQIPQHLLENAKVRAAEHDMLARLAKGQKISKAALAKQRLEGSSVPKHTQMPLKYPAEDLDVLPKKSNLRRPELKFFTDEQKKQIANGRRQPAAGILMQSMGMMLEIWNTLNVQCEAYVLDSFTFDDFVDAMKYKEIDPPCELLDEMHCAVLTQLVDRNNKIQVVKGYLDREVVEEDSGSGTSSEESEEYRPDNVPAKSTRSKVSQAVELRTEKVHSAAEMLKGGRGWKSRLAARDFEDGGWQLILVGLLHQLSANANFTDSCNRILAQLAPPNANYDEDTAETLYAQLDINLRVQALQIITQLSVTTAGVKGFLEQCSEDMTEVRKRKVEHQRERKVHVEAVHAKEKELKALRNAKPKKVPTPPTEPAAEESASEEDPPATKRRQSIRKRKRDEEAEREGSKEAKSQAAKAKQMKKLETEIEKLQAEIRECEKEIDFCDRDLREANVQRTKVLGKDRFCNRYYWFERNGQPYAGSSTSSTADHGYVNGRLWVQGPDEMEVQGLIDLQGAAAQEYFQTFGKTPRARREEEEGPLYLENASEWAYYDDPDSITELMAWLNERGEREKKLHRELFLWKDTIATYMTALKEYRDQNPPSDEQRCPSWTNKLAIIENGHVHSRPETKKALPKGKKRGGGIARSVRGRK
ncbi:hypothetical protein K470DRAFT_256014 [Piedraia hortae CBS 480.64]|uniref:WAC domain-containing protein n=1 Tax=Piedraia hortae CBS 480.64 TaxID=1314780 RepID=A0A6A7C6Q8_9PEZI|nr:hypothetical protein K470DRAFT_256014 [Piedraia hortae CBS 480.64]